MESKTSLIVPDTACAYLQHVMPNDISTQVQLAVIRMLSNAVHPVSVHICMLVYQQTLMPLLCMQVVLPPS